MVSTKTNTQNNTNTRRTTRRNIHLEKPIGDLKAEENKKHRQRCIVSKKVMVLRASGK